MKLKKNFHFLSLKISILGKSYTLPGNIAKDTADEKYFNTETEGEGGVGALELSALTGLGS